MAGGEMAEFSRRCRYGLYVGFLFFVGLVALILWLTYRPSIPEYYITDFSLLSSPAGNLTALASYALAIDNKNKLGIDHDPISLSFSFASSANSSANATIAGFYLGRKYTAYKSGYFTGDGRTSAAWKTKVSDGSAVFRVAVESAIRYKSFGDKGKGKRGRVSLAGDVAVDKDGKKTKKWGIRLRSAAPRVSFRYCGPKLLLGFIVCVVMI